MSTLLDKLAKLSEGRSQPIGFEAARARAKLYNMLLLAKIPLGYEKLLSAAVQENVDAFVFTLENRKKEKQTISKYIAEINEIPWGVIVTNISKEDTQELLEMKCDFIVLTPDITPAYILKEENLGKVLQLDPSLDLELIRTIPRLSVDAILLETGNQVTYPLTVHQLMTYERLVGGTGKHILATMPVDMPIEDMETMWELGARGMIVDITEENYRDRLIQVKEAIKKLPTNKKKSKEKFGALLPYITLQSPAEEPDEEEDI